MTDPSTVVLLVRHGTTPTTGRVLPGRAPGLHLSDVGVRQAEDLAERLAGLPIAAVYASPLERAIQTAAPTAQRHGLDVLVDEGLLECDVGEWTGRALADLTGLPEWSDVQRSPATFRFPGGEGFEALQSRIVAAVERLRRAHPGQVIACFSHADPLKAALAHALATPLDAFQRLWISPASVSVVSFAADGTPTVVATNTTAGPVPDPRPA